LQHTELSAEGETNNSENASSPLEAAKVFSAAEGLGVFIKPVFTIGNFKFSQTCILDTGCQVHALIPERFLPLEERTNIKEIPSVISLTGHKLQLKGALEMKIKIGPAYSYENVIIVGEETGLQCGIIGLPLLIRFGVALDFENESMQIQGRLINSIFAESYKYKVMPMQYATNQNLNAENNDKFEQNKQLRLESWINNLQQGPDDEIDILIYSTQQEDNLDGIKDLFETGDSFSFTSDIIENQISTCLVILSTNEKDEEKETINNTAKNLKLSTEQKYQLIE